MVHRKELVIDLGCSFHICCEKEKFSNLRLCIGGFAIFSNDERVKVEGIGEVAF